MNRVLNIRCVYYPTNFLFRFVVFMDMNKVGVLKMYQYLKILQRVEVVIQWMLKVQTTVKLLHHTLPILYICLVLASLLMMRITWSI